ncbi:MFS general substrate transporter [Glarea lozoyensis ATCC 20868]|uniref:MFS general substrate transporter n=1 Tax=Glarea lozoyensis (strain ATCC 20868 / MF5171) TaxID=1116229 RepID=S3D9K0_GLAL2|nr:MFS general substrate transporter [Glarea lozoyensis ATCC 20868]EPE28666.1 MFS general substrate transporter [Glarea lozoyensis ATCC 20868]
MDHHGDRNEKTPSHTLLTESGRLEELHTVLDNGDETTSSSAKQSTHIGDKKSDVEKSISLGEYVDNSDVTEKIESKKGEAQNTAVMPNEQEKDPNLVGWEGELYGRRKPLFVGYFIFAIFQIPVAVARNVETIMLFRFLQGVFGASTMAIIGGALADFWGPVERGLALGLFTGAVFIGPVAGPIAGGFIVMNNNLGWGWTAWMTFILAISFWLIALFICSESYAPVILQQKARRLRFETKNWALHAPADEQQVDLRNIAQRTYLATYYSLYGFIYGVVYLFFEAYPVAFQEQRHWNLGVGALPFLGITVGVMAGVAVVVYTSQTRFKRKMLANGGKPIPEERLLPMILGAILLPIGLFWFAWTSSPSVHWAAQVLAGIPIGLAVELVLLQGMSYIIDVYLMYANSALAGNTFVRSLFGAGFPMFAAAMFHSLGVDWATSVLGFISIAFLPCPLFFFFYGKKIRSWSKYSPKT